MIAPYRIKYDGKWYDAGDELPASPVTKQDVLTLKDIESMKFFALKAEASKNGVDTEGKNANQIRNELIKKLGL